MCIRDSSHGGPPRFTKGATVYARLANGWEQATVLENDNPTTAYRLRVSDQEVYAPMDDDLFVRTDMPTPQQEVEMEAQIEEIKKQAMMMQQMKQQQMQQQAIAMNGGMAPTGTALDRGATVPDGPLAQEQVMLVELITQHKSLAMNRAARGVMTGKQIKMIERAQVKAKGESDEGRRLNIIQKAQTEVYRQLTQEQQMQISQRAQEEMARVNEAILGPQEQTWLGNLTPEQRQVWENTQMVASKADPQAKQQLTRKGQLKVGKMLSQEQQQKMADDMKAIREGFMSDFTQGEQKKQADEDAEDEDAAAKMMEQMAMGC
eukprot:TRINITY_DN3797_c0_g1_i3.p1 TRINITY_DN3797_c0_g1~~TRINITY_DN3797_c0_g1_i3.p1  ORF type:complete len:319 (+),score=129.14 TRINITY_DN3797_c0_g1_i3:163-1119(+)